MLLLNREQTVIFIVLLYFVIMSYLAMKTRVSQGNWNTGVWVEREGGISSV